MPSFSIIIPIYNTKIEHMSECFQSIIDQTYTNWECVLVNDCSNDQKTLAFIKDFADSHHKFKIVSTKINSGCGPARNVGLLHTNNDLVIYLDSDDYFELNALEIINKYFQQFPDLDILSYNNFILTDNVRKRTVQTYDGFEPYKILNSQNENIVKDKTPAWSKCFSRKFINHYKLFFLENRWYCEDIYYQIVSYSRANKILFIDEPLITYRLGHLSMNTTWTLKSKAEETFNHMVAAYETIKFDRDNRIAKYYRYFFTFLFEKHVTDGVKKCDTPEHQFSKESWWLDILQKADKFIESLPK